MYMLKWTLVQSNLDTTTEVSFTPVESFAKQQN